MSNRNIYLKIFYYLILIGIIVVVIIKWDFVKYYYYVFLAKTVEIKNNIKLPTPATSPISTANWQTFSNQNYCLKYPADWVYYQSNLPSASAITNTYQETYWFDIGPKQDNLKSSGDINISTYSQDLSRTIQDVKEQAETVSRGPDKLVEETSVTLGPYTYRRMTYSRFSKEPTNYSDDNHIYYLTSIGNNSFVFSILPYPKYLAIDLLILESFRANSNCLNH